MLIGVGRGISDYTHLLVNGAQFEFASRFTITRCKIGHACVQLANRAVLPGAPHGLNAFKVSTMVHPANAGAKRHNFCSQLYTGLQSTHSVHVLSLFRNRMSSADWVFVHCLEHKMATHYNTV